MSEIYPQVLRQILVDHGRGVCDDPRRLKALLRDYLGQHPGDHEQAINVLLLALENRTVSELLGSEGLPLEMVKSRVATRLHTSLGLTEQVAGWAVATWAAALAPQAVVTPAPGVSETGGPKPLTQPMATPQRTDAAQLPDHASSYTEPVFTALPAEPEPARAAGRIVWIGAAVGLILFGLCAGIGFTWLLSSRGGDKSAANKDATAKGTPKNEPVDKNWKVIFRSADPSIWNDDVNKGPDHFAMALELVPSDIRFLRLTNTQTKEYVIIPISKDRLGKKSDDGRYGWDGTNAFGWRGHHLGIYFKIWTADGVGDIAIAAVPNFRGWGFGHSAHRDDAQHYSWAGKPISRTVFEIAVKSEPLTEAESKKWLRAGNPRE